MKSIHYTFCCLQFQGEKNISNPLRWIKNWVVPSKWVGVSNIFVLFKSWDCITILKLVWLYYDTKPINISVSAIQRKFISELLTCPMTYCELWLHPEVFWSRIFMIVALRVKVIRTRRVFIISLWNLYVKCHFSDLCKCNG